MPSPHTKLPLLPDQPNAGKPTADADARLVLDGLCFMQAPSTVNRLGELLAHGHWQTQRGGAFSPQVLRPLLTELKAQGLVEHDDQGRWQPLATLGARRFGELVDEPASRDRWWSAWRGLMRFDTSWHLEQLYDAALMGALRVVVWAGGGLADYQRLCRLTGGDQINPVHLALALLRPFDAVRWQRMNAELQLQLLRELLSLPLADDESVTAPLWSWLHHRSQADAAALHDFVRLALASRLVLCGQTGEARRVVDGLPGAASDALRAGADIADGQFEAGITAFEAALKQRAAETGKRKQLLPEALAWVYALALLSRSTPVQWTAARRFVASEAGRRDADPYTFWGIWQEAIDQRLGDSPRDAGRFHLLFNPQRRLPGQQQLSHLLLAAWLDHRPPSMAALRDLVQRLDLGYGASGHAWLALLTRRAGALLLGDAPAAADAAMAFPIGAPADRWREALNAIVALGAVPGADGVARADGATDRLVWLLQASRAGRIKAVLVTEQKAGARGLGKPRPVSLLNLQKRADLPAHDAAVLRAVKKAPFGAKLYIDKTVAVQALLRHPHVAWMEDPLRFIELAESLPQLEVLSRGDQLQFKVLDPIRPEDQDALADSEDDDDEFEDDGDSDGDDSVWNYRRSRNEPSRPPVLLFRDGSDRARLVRVTAAQLRVAELVSQGWQVPTGARAELDAALRVLGTHFQLASDADTGQQVPASAVLHAELTPVGLALQLQLVAAPFGDFGPRLPPGSGRERVTTVHQGLTLSTQRDLATELAPLRSLHQTLPWLDDGQHLWILDDPEQALAAVEALNGLAPDIVCEWPKGQPMRVRQVEARQVAVRVSSGRGDWLSLDGELMLDGGEVLRLEQLLALLATGRSRYIALGDGQFLALTDALRQQLADLRALAQPQGGGSRIAAMAALAWSGQDGAPTLQGDAAWTRRLQRWDQAQQREHALPAGLQAELRDYQVAGWRWLMRLADSGFGAVLADDMGLGKTLQTLGLLVARAAGGPALVMAPTSVTGNWLAEAARFTPGLRVSLYGDVRAAGEPDDDTLEAAESAESDGSTDKPEEDSRTAARRAQLQALGAGDLLVCSYGLLQRDAELFAGFEWHTVVLDEAQAIKNPAARRSRAAHALQAEAKIALTGTPIENRLAELWSIMAFANPGLLGSAETFNQRFANPIERDGDTQASRRLRRLIAPFVLRRTKTEVLADLPPRTEIVHQVVTGAKERALLEALRRQAEEQVHAAMASTAAAGGGEGQAQMHILAALTRLRRAACDPRLVAPELGIIGAKVQAFEQLALELVAGRHKALVFSQFTDFLVLLRERLDAAGLSYQYLDGSTPQAQRMQRVNAFQAGQGDFFLISLKAGGFGLNLTMADYVIIADPWWNPAAEDQASGRAHRIGQQRPVTVYRLVTQGSIEERIVKLHHSKRALADGVLAGQDGGGSAPMGSAELMALLHGETEGDGEGPVDASEPGAGALGPWPNG